MDQQSETPVIEMTDVIKQRVLDGHPLTVNGKLSDAAAKAHMAMVASLLDSTRKPVTVVYMPD